MTTPHLIVGGGLAGLSAALRLVRQGQAVTVLEASSRLGGRAQSPSPDGFALNLGPHAFYPRSQRILRELGVPLGGGVPERGLTFRLGGRIVPMPTGALSLLAHPSLSLRDKWRLGGWLAATTRGDPAALDEVPVARWLDGARLEGTARAFAEALVRVSSYGNAPERLSAGQIVRQLRAALEGVIYADGGWGRVVASLADAARAAGARIVAGARVEAIEIEGDEVRAARAGGERLACASLLSTLSPRATVSLLGERAPAALRAFAEEATPLRAACLDVALRSEPRDHPSVVLDVDEPLYLSVHTHAARLAPEGGAVIHVARYLGLDEAPAPGHRGQLEALLDQAQPGWREQVVEARFSPAFTVTHAAPLAAQGGTAGRPSVGAAGLANLFLAGDWVGPEGHLADACLLSARGAAEEMIARVGRVSVAS